MVSFFRNPGNKSFSFQGAESPAVLLLAEGDAEARYLSKWLSITGRAPQQIAVVCFRGTENLKVVLRSLVDSQNFESITGIGFFLDAEQNPAKSRVDSVRATLQELDLVPRSVTIAAGRLVRSGKYKIALFVSPNNHNPGCIENIVLREIATTEFAPCIERFEHCISEIAGSPTHIKTLVQAYIGARNPTLCGTGRGFDSGCLDVMHDAYEEIRRVFNELIENTIAD